MSIEISREALQLVDMLHEKRMAAALTIIVGEGLPTSEVTTILRSSNAYRNAISIINAIFIVYVSVESA